MKLVKIENYVRHGMHRKNWNTLGVRLKLKGLNIRIRMSVEYSENIRMSLGRNRERCDRKLGVPMTRRRRLGRSFLRRRGGSPHGTSRLAGEQ